MKPVLVTGGAGFIGTNLAKRLLDQGQSVIVYDNLSRAGVEQNLRWLHARYPELLQVEVADVRDSEALARVVPRVGAIYHFAAQTAVTTSLLRPDHDFDVNARATLGLLEAVRACGTPPTLLFTSTNKVYGGLHSVSLECVDGRYRPQDPALHSSGIGESCPLDFHTPYGCSKGTADQYVLDYARSFGLPATVFRMSCIYGPHQCGTEDQGWVAHFALRALAEETVFIYGDGNQVRDLLYVDDLIDAMQLAQRHINRTAGQAFNMGGGTGNVASLLEVVEVIRALHGRCKVSFDEWRPSDQRYYVSDTRKFQELVGWQQKVDVQAGIRRMYEWLRASRLSASRAAVRGAELPSSPSETHSGG